MFKQKNIPQYFPRATDTSIDLWAKWLKEDQDNQSGIQVYKSHI